MPVHDWDADTGGAQPQPRKFKYLLRLPSELLLFERKAIALDITDLRDGVERQRFGKALRRRRLPAFHNVLAGGKQFVDPFQAAT